MNGNWCGRSGFAVLMACGAPVVFAQNAAAPASAPAESRQPVTLKVTVFEDLDGNGRRDAGEPALAGMPVSDGVGWAMTDAEGSCAFTLDPTISGSAFVSTPAGWRASKQFYVSADFETFGGKTQTGEIGLVRDPARLAERFIFVQLTDTHVTEGVDTATTMMDDLRVVNRLSDSPTFIVTTGDLVNSGKNPGELANYARAIAMAKYPYYNVVGNHDYGGQLRGTENYETYLGPRYYSFTIGRYHFISKDIIAESRDPEAARRQEKWIEEDIRLNAKDKRIVVFQHYLPTNGEFKWWSRFDTAAIFSGHWHGRRERVRDGILDVNSAPLRFGGIDRSPRGFRIIHVDGDRLTCEWRVGQQEQRVEVIHPADGAVVNGETVSIQVLAYDTAVRVKEVRYTLAFADSAQPLTGKLAPDGRWMWRGSCRVPQGLSKQNAELRIEVTAADGSEWKANSRFAVSRRAGSPPRMGEPWRFFHNDAGHRGYVSEGPRPPLSMAWATNVGGTILLASPVIADGRVYVGTGFSESLDDCAVHALDLVTGRPLWRTPVDSSIQHSLAVWEDNVLAVSQAAKLYCLDRDGKQKWVASLAHEENDRWELSFPVTDGKVVYAGRCNGFGAYSLEDGKPLWKQPGGRDWWPHVYSGPSLGSGLVYQGGPFMRALDPASGEIVWNQAKTVVSTVAVVPAVVERNEAGDRLYVFQNQKTLLCLDGKTGDVIWQGRMDRPASTGQSGGSADQGIEVPLGNETGTPAVGERVVCVGGGQVKWPGDDKPSAAMHGFDKQTGRLLWRFPVTAGVVSSIPYHRDEATITSSPVIVGEIVYFGSNDGYFYALDVNSGSLVWRYRLGVPIASTAAVSGNAIVVAAWDGTVYAFTTESR